MRLGRPHDPFNASCLPDLDAEWDHLRALLPGGEAIGSLPLAAAEVGCNVLAWARSGLMHLTGYAEAAPRAPTAPVLARAQLIAAAISELSPLPNGTLPAGRRTAVNVPRLLAERAQLLRWQRHGMISANGSCRLLATADGWLAVNLARPDDVASVPAVLGIPVTGGDTWAAMARHAAARPPIDVADAAQAVGIPVSVLATAPAEPLRLNRAAAGPSGEVAARRESFVLDLSAMWAAPLCARILRDAGWRVLKVEDSRRPDGARSGQPQFYANLHAGIPVIQLDFGSATGRAELARLASRATAVIESSRPRAVRQLGLRAEDWLAAAPGRI